MKIEIALSNKAEAWLLAGFAYALLFVVYKLASQYGSIILGWFINVG